MVARTRRQTKPANPPELTPEAGWQQLEQTARQQLGMSAEAFLRAWQAGEIIPRWVPHEPIAAPSRLEAANGTPAGDEPVQAPAEGPPRRRRRRLPEVRELTREEGQKLFDDLARRYMGMSGEEFLRAWDAGEIKNPDRPEVMRVVFAIPFAR
jgi:hypothetical protein